MSYYNKNEYDWRLNDRQRYDEMMFRKEREYQTNQMDDTFKKMIAESERLRMNHTLVNNIFKGNQTPGNNTIQFEIDCSKHKNIKFQGDWKAFIAHACDGRFFPKYKVATKSMFEIDRGTNGLRELLYIVGLDNKYVDHSTYFAFAIKSLTLAETQFEVKIFDIVKYIHPTNVDLKYGLKNLLKNSGAVLFEELIKDKFTILETSNNNNKENEIMATNNNVSMIESTMSNAKAALSEGVQLAVSNQASEVILGLVSDILGVDHPVLQTAEGRALAKVVGALLVETMATSILDASAAKQVGNVCQSAATFNVASLLNGKLDVIRPRLLQLVNLASVTPVSK